MRNELQRSAELREDFKGWLDSFEPDDPVIGLPKEQDFFELASSNDILPADYCVKLDIPRGSTYAKAIEEIDPKASWLAKTSPRPKDWMVKVSIDVPVEDLCADYIAEDAAKELIGGALKGYNIVAAKATVNRNSVIEDARSKALDACSKLECFVSGLDMNEDDGLVVVTVDCIEAYQDDVAIKEFVDTVMTEIRKRGEPVMPLISELVEGRTEAVLG